METAEKKSVKTQIKITIANFQKVLLIEIALYVYK